jgi:hypothetical protein
VNLAASLTSVAKEASSIFRIMWNQQPQHFSLSRRQSLISRDELFVLDCLLPIRANLLECLATDLSRAASSIGLVKKSIAPPYCHWNVAAASDEDDRYRASFALKVRLQFKTRHAGPANVGNQA